jgi:hypothetical protein
MSPAASIVAAMMMFSPTGWSAHFTGDRAPFAVLPVESFNGDSEPLVVDPQVNRLREARSITGFQRIERGDRVAAAVAAAPGWRLRIWEGRDKSGDSWVEPIAVWLVNDDGCVMPVPGGSDSWLEPLGGQECEILPPDHDREPPIGDAVPAGPEPA